MAEKAIFGRKRNTFADDPTRCKHNKNTRHIFRTEDGTEEIRLYPTNASQCAINSSAEIKNGRAELLYTYIDAEPIKNGGGCTVNIRFFYHVTAEAIMEDARPSKICGLAVFSKTVQFRRRAGNDKRNGSITAVRMEKDDTGVHRVALKKKNPAGEALIGIPPLILSYFNNDLYFGREGKAAYLSLIR